MSSRSLFGRWEIHRATGKIQHAFRYDLQEEHAAIEIAMKRLVCHLMIDQIPDDAVSLLLSQVCTISRGNQVEWQDLDYGPSSMGKTSAMLLRSIIATRAPAHSSNLDDEIAEP